MSLLNGTVEAPYTRWFFTWQEASDFIKELGQAFEGVQIRQDGFYVNYY